LAALVQSGIFERTGNPRFAVLFGNAPTGMRFDYLSAIAEVDLVTVVVWRVVAGGDDNAGVGLQIADSKRKLRSRARAIKDNGVTSVSRGGFCCKLGKYLREDRKSVA